MLTNWSLNRFKSYRSPLTLELAPLTVFAGANSSGKSSIVQSMLLIAQSLASQTHPAELILNGGMTRLGNYSDILSWGSTEPTINIGFTVDQLSRNNIYAGGYASDLRNVTCTIAAKPQGTAAVAGLYPKIETLHLHSELKQSPNFLTEPVDFNIEATGEPTLSHRADDSTQQSLLLASAHSSARQFKTTLVSECISKEVRADLPTGSIKSASFRSILPERLWVDRLPRKEFATAAAEAMVSFQPSHSTARGQMTTLPINRSVLDILRSFIDAKETNANLGFRRIAQELNVETNATFNLYMWFNAIATLTTVQRVALRSKVGANENLRTALVQSMTEVDESFAATPHWLTSTLFSMTEAINRHFTQSFHYLGPLRDEPKALYPLAGEASHTSVGLRGEYTAAVLQTHANSNVQTIDPQELDDAHPSLAISETLSASVDRWLSYFGMSSAVHTSDEGKLGHTLKILSPDGDIPQDLTHVGVGISQVLPILVLCLLAQKSDTVVIEQPELHLHPRAQALLADFFIAQSLCGRQCIIETHSEHIVNRIRYRVAQAKRSALLRRLSIHFFSQSEGETTANLVKINEYGAIKRWPDGFFDQAQQEAHLIVEAASEKRAQERRP